MANYQNTCKKTPSHKFHIGDKVVYTNEYGVCWGIKTIAAYAKQRHGDEPCYYYEGTDTPWYATEQRYFMRASDHDLQYEGNEQHFQLRYGFLSTLDRPRGPARFGT